MEITCHQTGYKTVINFKPYSWTNKELHKFDGYIYDNNKKKVKALFGYWTHCFYTCEPQAYEDYLKSGKRLPTLEVDEFFVEKNSHSHSSQQPIQEEQLEEVNVNLKKKYPKLFDLNEIWRAAPRPSYSNDVLNFYLV